MKTKKSNTTSWMNRPILIIMFLISSAVFSAFAQNNCKDLLRAVKSNNITKVAELLKTINPDCVFRGDGEPRSPLVAAARLGNLEIGKLLITAKADVEFHAFEDETPLISASAYGYLDFVKYLLVNHAEINKKLKGNGTALLMASKNGHVETVKYLISKGAKIDSPVGSDGTALIASVKNGHHDVAKILLEYGADPYLTTSGDEYPMYHARMMKDKAMIALLEQFKKQ